MMTLPGTESDNLPIFLALDGSWRDMRHWIDRLGGKVYGFKVGSVLFTEAGPNVVEEIKKTGSRVFLDLKYHDIPNTVAMAAHQAFGMGADYVTVHAMGGRAMLEAAAAEQTESQSILAVTVLTSHDQHEVTEIGLKKEIPDLVTHFAGLAIESGVKGLVCSPHEVENLRKKHPEATLVTPGVRMGTEGVQDQKRVATPRSALHHGASFIVLGRALTDAEDWEKTWEEITSSLVDES